VSVHVGQATFETIVVESKTLVVQAHEVKDGGVEVVHADTVLDGLEAELVAFAMAVTGFDPCAGKKTGEGIGVMITSGAVAL